MNRRGFLKGLGAAPVALVALPVVAKATEPSSVDVLPISNINGHSWDTSTAVWNGHPTVYGRSIPSLIQDAQREENERWRNYLRQMEQAQARRLDDYQRRFAIDRATACDIFGAQDV